MCTLLPGYYTAAHHATRTAISKRFHAVQDCTIDQPCVDAAAIQRFSQYSNPSLFTSIIEVCGGKALEDLTKLVVRAHLIV